MILPMPTVPVLSRVIGDDSMYLSQDITVTPTACSTLESAIEACLQGSAQVKRSVFERAKSGGMDVFESVLGTSGCPRVRTPTVESAVQFVVDSLKGAAIMGELRPGLDARSGTVAVLAREGEDGSSSVGGEIKYTVDGLEAVPKSGAEITETLIAAWKSCELISIVDSHLKSDIVALRDIKEVIAPDKSYA